MSCLFLSLFLRGVMLPQDASEPITKNCPGGLPLAGPPGFYRFSPTGAEITNYTLRMQLWNAFQGLPFQ